MKVNFRFSGKRVTPPPGITVQDTGLYGCAIFTVKLFEASFVINNLSLVSSRPVPGDPTDFSFNVNTEVNLQVLTPPRDPEVLFRNFRDSMEALGINAVQTTLEMV
mgnify:CR=1 FL=1